ncbi:MAG: NMP kinase [Candidatus Aenigmatarchaeota archaeon]|nr:MAG: NMP kinase [Candidatus Aenigmarchaeota archaeon]
MLLSVTGTPGTGKTSISEHLGKLLSMKVIHLNRLAEEMGYILGTDPVRGSLIVDIERLAEELNERDAIIEGHLSHLVNPDRIVLLRCKPPVLKKRLEEKGWSETKVQENLDAEILGIIASEVLELGIPFIEVETSSLTPEEAALLIKKRLDLGESDKEITDFLLKYEELLSR